MIDQFGFQGFDVIVENLPHAAACVRFANHWRAASSEMRTCLPILNVSGASFCFCNK
ncbi:MAG: hypothetical protein J0H40_18230 [Rhizobiales bacterium]|nr:hypothetical protein [Hyphomicrobiales bacterium]